MAAAANSVAATAPLLINISGNASGPAPVAKQVVTVINWLTFSIGLPAIALVMYALKNLSKGGNKVPAHVMFLLVSDVISFFGRPHVVKGAQSNSTSSGKLSAGSGGNLTANATNFLFNFSVISNITLMLFISQERHVSVAYPRCLACCAAARRSPAVALAMWAAPFGVLALAVLDYKFWFAVVLLAPFPLLLFFAVDAWRALVCSRSHAATPERRRTVWGLAAIAINYTFLYVPFIVSVLLEALQYREAELYLRLVSHLLLYLAPLVDPFLYIFMSGGLKEVKQALPCCSKRTQEATPSVTTVAESVDVRL